MACAGLLLASVLAAVTPSVPDAVRPTPQPTLPSAPPRTVATKPIDLSVPVAIHNPAILSSGANAALAAPGPEHWDGGARPGFSIGPLRTEFGGVTDRHMHVATMKLDGISVFGASISGSIDSRSARITFTWPTSP